MKKKIIGMLLIVAMVCQMFTVSAMATVTDSINAEETELESIAETEEIEAEIELFAETEEDTEEETEAETEEPETEEETEAETEEPVVLNGWVTDDSGNTYYYVENVAKTGLATINGYKYYFDKDGVMQTGWQIVTESGTQYKYYFKTTGEALTDGWYVINSKGVYVSAGKPTTVESYQNAGKYVYYFNASGRLHLGWRSITESGTVNKYYTKCTDVELSSNEAGMVVTGLTWINGQRYYFNAGSGRLHYGWRTDSETGYKFYFDTSTGAMVTGSVTLDGKRYYFNVGSGRLHYGWRTDSDTGYKYYYDASTGVMQTGWVTISGKKYFFNTGSGRLHYGWRTDSTTGNKYYCDTTTGVMQTGYVTIGGTEYYFGSDGVLISSLVKAPTDAIHPIYYNATIKYTTDLYTSTTATTKIGTIKKGASVKVIYRRSSGRCAIVYNGYVYYVRSGALNYTSMIYTSSDYTTAQKEAFINSKGYTSSTNYLIWISTYTQHINIFKKSGSQWVLYKTATVATGKITTPTPLGVFKLYKKSRYHKYSSSYYEYVSYFNSTNSVHTRIKYYKGGFVNATLGKPLSSGCVRMPDDIAKFVYDEVPLNTTVLVY